MTAYINDDLHYSNLIQILVETLKKTYSSTSIDEIKHSEAKLATLETEILDNIQSILQTLVINQSTAIDLNLKKSLLIYYKNTIQKKIDTRSLAKEQLVAFMNIFCQLLLLGNLQDCLLKYVSNILVDILSSFIIFEDSQIILGLCTLVFEFILNNQQFNDLRTCIKIYQSVFIFFQVVISSRSFAYGNCIEIAQIQSNIAEIIIHKLSELHTSQCFPREDEKDDEISSYDIVKDLLGSLAFALMKLKKFGRIDEILDVFITKFASFAGEMFFTTVMNTSGNVFYFTGTPHLDRTMNTLKVKALQLFSFFISQDSSADIISKIITHVISSLEALTNEKICTQCDTNANECYDPLIFQMVMFLSSALARDPFNSLFAHLIRSFALNFLFSFLGPTNREFAQIQNDGEGYHMYMLDLISKQHFKNSKTASAVLLIKLCSTYDWLPSFILSFCLQVIDFALSENKGDCIEGYPLLMTDLKMSDKLLSSSSESIIDTSLLICCILAKDIARNPKRKDHLRSLIENHQRKLHCVSSCLIKDKLCLLYGLFLDEFYSVEDLTKSHYISSAFDFLFTQVINCNDYPGCAYQAVNSIEQLLSSNKYNFFISNVVIQFIPFLFQQIKDINIDIFFDMLREIVASLDINEYVYDLSKILVERILTEAHQGLRERKCNQYIHKAFHILRTLVDKYEVATEDKKFEDIIEPVVICLKWQLEVDISDEILILLATILRNWKKVSKLFQSVLPSFKDYAEKQKGITEELFEVLNLVIVYDIDQCHVTNSGALFEILHSSLIRNEEFEISSILANILSQVLLSSNHMLPEDIVIEIAQICIMKVNFMFENYKDNFPALTGHYDSYFFTSYLTTIYAGMFKCPHLVLKCLNDGNFFFQLLQWTEMMALLEFYSVIQAKILILGICSLLTVFFSEKYLFPVNLFFPVILKLLLRQRGEEKKNLAARMNEDVCSLGERNRSEGNIREDESDSDDSESEDNTTGNQVKLKKKQCTEIEDSSSDDALIHQLINKGIFPTKKYDEFEIFFQTMHNIHKQDEKLYLNWFSVLTPKEKEEWEEMMHSRRINLTYNNVNIDIPRRTVTIKRK